MELPGITETQKHIPRILSRVDPGDAPISRNWVAPPVPENQTDQESKGRTLETKPTLEQEATESGQIVHVTYIHTLASAAAC